MAGASESMVVTTPSEREVRTERIFNAPPELLWRALTEAPLLTRWWARGNPMTIERFEPERGGHWRIVEHAPDGDFGFEGRFRELEAPRRLSQTFEWDGEPGHVSVDDIELEDLGDGRTRLVDTSTFMNAEERDAMLGYGMTEGVSDSYAALDKVLASMT
jgi:uncharacterized protein YndB with AHSA1/START domain